MEFRNMHIMLTLFEWKPYDIMNVRKSPEMVRDGFCIRTNEKRNVIQKFTDNSQKKNYNNNRISVSDGE